MPLRHCENRYHDYWSHSETIQVSVFYLRFNGLGGNMSLAFNYYSTTLLQIDVSFTSSHDTAVHDCEVCLYESDIISSVDSGLSMQLLYDTDEI